MEYELKKPFEFGGKEYKKITLQKPRTKHLKSLPLERSAWNIGTIGDLIVGVSNEPPSVVGMLELEDLMGAFEVVAPFLTSSQETGN